MLVWAKIVVARSIEQDISRVERELFRFLIGRGSGVHDDRFLLLGDELSDRQNSQRVRKHRSEFRVPLEQGDIGDCLGISYFVVPCRIPFHILEEVVHTVGNHRRVRNVAPVGCTLWILREGFVRHLFRRTFKVGIADLQLDAIPIGHARLNIEVEVAEQQQSPIGGQTLLDVRQGHIATAPSTAARVFAVHGSHHARHH